MMLTGLWPSPHKNKHRARFYTLSGWSSGRSSPFSSHCRTSCCNLASNEAQVGCSAFTHEGPRIWHERLLFLDQWASHGSAPAKILAAEMTEQKFSESHSKDQSKISPTAKAVGNCCEVLYSWVRATCTKRRAKALSWREDQARWGCVSGGTTTLLTSNEGFIPSLYSIVTLNFTSWPMLPSSKSQKYFWKAKIKVEFHSKFDSNHNTIISNHFGTPPPHWWH